MSKIWIQIDEKDAILNGMRHLRLYTEGMYLTPDTSLFSEEINKQIIKYYRSTDASEDIAYQKLLGVAVIKAVNDNPDVYGPKKDKVGIKCAKEFVECLKISKQHYQATCHIGNYENKSQKEIEQILKETEADNRVVKKAHLIHKIKAFVKRYTARVAKKTAVGAAVTKATGSVTAGVVVGTASIILDTIIPPAVKNDIHEGLKKTGKWVENTAKKTWEKTEKFLDKTEVGTHVKNTLVLTAGIVKDVAVGIKDVAHDVIDVVSDGVKAAGKTARKLFTKAKTFLFG